MNEFNTYTINATYHGINYQPQPEQVENYEEGLEKLIQYKFNYDFTFEDGVQTEWVYNSLDEITGLRVTKTVGPVIGIEFELKPPK